MSRHNNKKVKKKELVNGFSREQMDDFQDVFDLFAGTEEGTIKPSEIIQLMKDAEMEDKHPAIFKFLEALENKNSDKEIDFDTFIKEISLRFSDTNSEEVIKNNFELFAEPGENYIDVYTIKKLAKEIGQDDEELMELLKEVEDSGEKITYEEFTQILSSYKKK